MASESDSAVLELNDTDVNEDTEPPSVTDDNDEAPLIMEHGYDIAVKVDCPLKQMSTLETFVTYRVRCVCARWPTPKHVRRRYNHFRALHRRLSAAHPWTAAPPLPPLHSARQQLDRYSPSFVGVRTLALHAFLDRVAKHPILTHSEDLRVFLTTPDEDADRVLKPEGGFALWGLSAFSSDRPANGPRVRDPEFVAAADYLSALRPRLAALGALARALHSHQRALRAERIGMKRVCDAWATQAGGMAGRAASAVGVGAAAGGGGGGPPGGGGGGHLRARATLPLLAAYAAAHVDKIKQRDALHASYVSGSDTTGELHNRLEQASEALRSELADWIPKTRSEIKSLLLDIAERQVQIHKQTLMGWEQALKLSTETDLGDLFKTVSKNAVQNLSPSKYGTPTETEKDFDDLSNSSNEFEVSNTKSDVVSKASNSPDYCGVVKNCKLSLESEVSKNCSTDSYEVVKSCENVNNGDKVDCGNDIEVGVSDEVGKNGLNSEDEVGKNGLKSEDEVSSDPLRDFSEVDLSS